MHKLKLCIVMLICMTMAAGSFAQTGTPSTNTSSQDPMALSDPAMSKKLQSDLSSRNSQLGNTNVQWFDTGNGYYGTYTMGNTDYMVRYDKKGMYQDSYTKGDWNGGDVPSSLKSAYSSSQYKDQEVTGFWQNSDPTRRNYYFETRNNKGKTSRMWSDDKGKFSATAPKATSDSKANP